MAIRHVCRNVCGPGGPRPLWVVDGHRRRPVRSDDCDEPEARSGHHVRGTRLDRRRRRNQAQSERSHDCRIRKRSRHQRGRTNGVSIVGGTVQDFPTGVLVLNSTAVVVKDSQLVHNGDGVDLQAGSIGNTIKGNHFQDNTMRGIMSRSDSSANVIKDNTFAGNRVGILLFGAASSTVKGNTLSFSGLAGIRINVLAANNLIQENTAVSNPAGIEFTVTPTGSSIGKLLRENTLALNTCGLKGPVAGNTLKENLFEGNAADSCP